jgi:hypothetical protein
LSRYQITRVGIPITTATITPEFISILAELKDNKNCIGIMVADDQIASPAGYKVIQNDIGIEYKVLDVWTEDRDPVKATMNLLRQLKQLHSELLFEHAVLFTPGSPYIDDAISKILLSAYDDIRVVDTKGAPQIAAEFIESIGYKTIVRNYHDDFILNKNPKIDRNVVSIFSCLQNGYIATLRSALFNLQPDRVIVVGVGEEIYHKEYTLEEIVKQCDSIYNDRPLSFAFIFD